VFLVDSLDLSDLSVVSFSGHSLLSDSDGSLFGLVLDSLFFLLLEELSLGNSVNLAPLDFSLVLDLLDLLVSHSDSSLSFSGFSGFLFSDESVVSSVNLDDHVVVVLLNGFLVLSVVGLIGLLVNVVHGHPSSSPFLVVHGVSGVVSSVSSVVLSQPLLVGNPGSFLMDVVGSEVVLSPSLVGNSVGLSVGGHQLLSSALG
jgi:hypothetical protein